ncbi:MAG TPA: hypothetical protein VKE70_03460 [Candidatus Solibacter sp.]|nr:hypothetical protein [Candidatus Solibacter sp.]
MKIVVRSVALAVLTASLAGFAWQQQAGTNAPLRAQGGGRRGPVDTETLPPTDKSRDEILKAEHALNLKDASDLMELAQQLKLDLEKNDRYVVSMGTIKKTDDIEKLAKRIRGRLRH